MPIGSLVFLRLAAVAALVTGPAPGAGAFPPRHFSEVDAAVERGIRRGIYPGAVVVIGRRDQVLYARGYGHLTWAAGSGAPKPDSTLWDLASLTKVVGTASATMRLVDRGQLQLSAPVSRYLPRFRGGGKEQVTIRMLLDHTSGMRSYLPFFRGAHSRAQALDQLYAVPLQHRPGAVEQYSDLNAILLGMVLEKVTGVSLDELVRREVLGPLDMSSTLFRPPQSLWGRVAPSALWRGHPIRGQVNDPNAAFFGGVSGHAGLFSTGADLATFARTWLRGGIGPDGHRWVSALTLRRFITPPNDLSGTRLLGWDSPDTTATPSLFGRDAVPSTFGHTGWTGTELWVDPAHDLFLVFLTNRSYDPRVSGSIQALREVRADVSDAALRLVPPVCVQTLVAQC